MSAFTSSQTSIHTKQEIDRDGQDEKAWKHWQAGEECDQDIESLEEAFI